MVQRNHSNKNIIISFLTLLMMLILPTWIAAAPTDEATNVSTNKTWTITFNKAVDPTSVNLNSVYVLDQFDVKKMVQLPFHQIGRV